MTPAELQAAIQERQAKKAQRDELLAGVNPETAMQNPLALMGKLDDFKKAFELTRAIESEGDAIISGFVTLIIEEGA